MKKYIPILLSILIFSGFLVSQVAFDLFKISAGLSKKENKINAHYESIYTNLSLETIDQKKISLQEVDAPIVILNFWASWCKPCLEEFPSLNQLTKKYSDKQVKIIGVNSDEEDQLKNIKKIVSKYELNFPVVADKNSKILQEFMISSIPISIIFKNGKVAEVSRGKKDFSSGEFQEFLEENVR